VHICDLYRYAAPVIGMFVMNMLLGVINVIYLGHIGAVELAAASLGNMFVNISGFSLGIGYFCLKPTARVLTDCNIRLCSAIDTLGSQAFGAGTTNSF
jgi:Na+-driven multidrug efflux pump